MEGSSDAATPVIPHLQAVDVVGCATVIGAAISTLARSVLTSNIII